MKVKDLKAWLENTHDEYEVVIPVVRLDTIGPMPSVKLESASNGFDWDHGKFILHAESKLREITADEVKALRKRLNAENSPLTDLMSENWRLRHEIDELKRRLEEK